MENKIGLSDRLREFNAKPRAEKLDYWKEFLINNLLYIFMIGAIIVIGFTSPKFCRSRR